MAENHLQVSEEVSRITVKINETKYDFVELMPMDIRSKDEVNHFIIEFLNIIVKSFEQDEEAAFASVTNFGKKIGEFALMYDGRLDESIDMFSKIRQLLWKHMKGIMIELNVGIDAVFEMADAFDSLFDRTIYAFSTAYMNSYRENLDKAEDEFLELSAPVVPIFEGVAILPIIGGVNEKRAELLMKTALNEAAQRELDRLYIDLSGVTVVDTMVAHSIYKIIQSLELVGVKTVLAGIRPEVSHTMVSLGIDFSKIKTFSSLKQALTVYMRLQKI